MKTVRYKWIYKKKEGIVGVEDARCKAQLPEKIDTAENPKNMMAKPMSLLKYKHCLELIGVRSA